MKKTLIALAVLGSVAGVAQAQSAVTVYGKLDLGLQKITRSPTKVEPNHSSRLGFKGAEDLGGGLSAIFQIENRFFADTGAQKSTMLFEGQSIVGLTGGFGTVKLGRATNVVHSVDSAAADPFDGDGVPAMTALTAARISNTVTYTTPGMSGFSASAQAALSEILDAKNGWGIAGSYANGPIIAGAGYQKLAATVANGVQADVWGISGSYAFGPAKVLLGYDQADAKTGAAKTKNSVLGLTYTVGAGMMKAAFNNVKNPVGFAATTDRKYAIGYQHNLSKRTSLYADIARTNYGTTTKIDANGVQVGVTHNF